MNEILASQQFVVAGLGMTGRSVVRFLKGIGASVKIWDTRADAKVPEDMTAVTLGSIPADYWTDVDTLVLSPGIPTSHDEVAKARRAGVEIIGDIELFSRLNRAPTFGITGSNGKTTVTLLLTHILRECGFKVCAAGNVGKPVLDTIGGEWDFLVLELSSFQLETTTSLQLVGATLLNISDDHLDRHGTMQAYAAAKQRIFAHCDHAVIWRGQSQTKPFQPVPGQTKIGLDDTPSGFGYRSGQILWQGKPVLAMSEVKLVGEHNVLNIQAALGLALLAGLTVGEAADAAKTFISAPHRCVEIANIAGVSWIDDSKATNIGATLAALQGLGRNRTGKLILIAGGDAKGAELSALESALSEYVDELITLGKDGKAIGALVANSQHVADMETAVSVAHQIACAGDVVLLSPACASIDMFDNYAHRAKAFADAIDKVSDK